MQVVFEYDVTVHCILYDKMFLFVRVPIFYGFCYILPCSLVCLVATLDMSVEILSDKCINQCLLSP